MLDVGAEPGEGIASGLTGGEPGLYNVYATWRASENVSDGGGAFTITSESDEVVLPMVQQRTSLEAAGTWHKVLWRMGLPACTIRAKDISLDDKNNTVYIL